MSLVYKVVEDLVDSLLEHVKARLEDYKETLEEDLELFASRLVRGIVRAMAIGVFGTVLLSAGAIFALVGLVTYLSNVIGPALAWGVVGIVMLAVGGILLLQVMRNARLLKRAYILRNGE